jgi:NADH-quinone oxidoreductase subunit G
MSFSDVLLPIAPFTETSGTFVNAEGRVQGFHAVVKPLGDTRPAWKVLRVLANLLGLPGFDFESSQDVLKQVQGVDMAQVPADKLGNELAGANEGNITLSAAAGLIPAVASIYQLDGLVRRAPSLQLTADALQAASLEGAAA